jgi:hypothetical protein
MVHAERFEIRIWELRGTVDRERAQVVHVPLPNAYRGARSPTRCGYVAAFASRNPREAGGKARRPRDGGVVEYRGICDPGVTCRNTTSV